MNADFRIKHYKLGQCVRKRFSEKKCDTIKSLAHILNIPLTFQYVFKAYRKSRSLLNESRICKYLREIPVRFNSTNTLLRIHFSQYPIYQS